ncbi:hypothetical protein [Metapseudomonas otitidis]|uniref:hypothetical protein n=1 Tax=Metapseudomonas otitidis TaxID=319939 RepID=UPI0013F62041|nr:hypothetical protein [Pseudomonas otitidis]
MKIWACAKGANGYINREDGRYRLYFIWQVLKMRRENPPEFNALTFFSTHSREEKRREMVAVKSGYFRYKSKDIQGSQSGDSDSETLSHATLITILAQLETINFVINNELVPFTFTRLVAEETHLKFGNGNSYIPDLYGEFTADNPYYQKWNGRVAIEVCYTNPCSIQKIVDFRDHGIPIIEVKITDSIKVEKYIRSDDVEGSLERRYRQITEIVARQLYCKVLSDPVSARFHQDYVRQSEKEQADLIDKNKHETMLLVRKCRDAESIATTVSKERDGLVAVKNVIEKEKSELAITVCELGKRIDILEVELEKYKEGYARKNHEINDLRGELARKGILGKLKRYFLMPKEKL